VVAADSARDRWADVGNFPLERAAIFAAGPGDLGRQEVQGEALGFFLSPIRVESGVVIFRVVGNHHHPPSRVSADGAQVFQELPAGRSIELARLAPEQELAVAQADGPEVAHALASGVMEQNRILDFRRDPHPVARAVLLEVHFVHGPKINCGIGA
jgi:hypothetical protein